MPDRLSEEREQEIRDVVAECESDFEDQSVVDPDPCGLRSAQERMGKCNAETTLRSLARLCEETSERYQRYDEDILRAAEILENAADEAEADYGALFRSAPVQGGGTRDA